MVTQCYGRRAEETPSLEGVNYSQEADMDPRWEASSGVIAVAIWFVPIFIVIFSADLKGTQQVAAQERRRRIGQYRKSPESRLLILND